MQEFSSQISERLSKAKEDLKKFDYLKVSCEIADDVSDISEFAATPDFPAAKEGQNVESDGGSGFAFNLHRYSDYAQDPREEEKNHVV